MDRGSAMKKNSKNRGFSLIELIVLIAMISVLAGMLIPQFMKYATSKRQDACKANREALLNIYEKAVYDGQLELDVTDLGTFLSVSGDKMTTEYINQASDYLECPSSGAGNYVGQVVGNTAFIVCSEHPDEVCSIELVGWEAKAVDAKGGEPDYPIPADAPGAEPPGEGDAPEEPSSVDYGETCNTGIWPRPMNSEGKIDARWASAGGAKPGNSVSINAPLHFIDETGVEIVIVCANDASGKYKVSYEDAMSPIGKGSGALPYVVAASGQQYSDVDDNMPPMITEGGGKKTITDKEAWDEKVTIKKSAYLKLSWAEQQKYQKDEIKKDKYDKLSQEEKNTYEPSNGNKYIRYVGTVHHNAITHDEDLPSEEKIRANYGDMLTVNGITYIYALQGGKYTSIPKNTDTTYSTSYDGWYRVPALTTNN